MSRKTSCSPASKGCGLIILILSTLAGLDVHADPLPWTDNEKPPFIAIWKEPKDEPGGVDEYATWLNRKILWIDISPCFFYGHGRNWSEVEMPFDKMWSAWITAAPGRRAILDVPMLPPGATLAEGAKGTYNSHFTALATNLVANNLGQTILCMGPAGYLSPWRVSNQEDATNFTAFWKQIVTTMRAVPGAEKLQFDWQAPGGKIGYSAEDAYPGPDVVDYIGYNSEEGSGNPEIYPYPVFASDGEKLYRQKKAWDLVEKPALDQWCAFAKAHGKPFSIPLWHLAADHTRSEGFDDPYFIQAMADYVRDPANNVYFISYFEYYHYSWLSATNGYKTNEPKAAAAFQQCFSLNPAKSSP